VKKTIWIIAGFIAVNVILNITFKDTLGICAGYAQDKAFIIAVFKEEGFPSEGTPKKLTPQWIYNALKDSYRVRYIDSVDLSQSNLLNPRDIDLLILPYGETFPYQAFPAIKSYIMNGGGLMTIAGKPFWRALRKNEDKWQDVDIFDPYQMFLAPLGIKYYDLEDGGSTGLCVTTSRQESPIIPSRGNVFPYRVPVRDFMPLPDTAGKIFSVLVKSWKNPYASDIKDIPKKWCLIGAKGEDHPLNPDSPQAAILLKGLVEKLAYPLVISEVKTDLAAYRDKESVKISAMLTNCGKRNAKFKVEITILDKVGKVVFRQARRIVLGKREKVIIQETWKPKRFKSNFYTLRITGKELGQVLDIAENGFVVIDKNLLSGGPLFQADKGGFYINGKKKLIFGINYYESKTGELMWLRPNILRVREDFEAMAALGIDFVRIHYHHSKWFRDYFSDVLKEQLDPYFQGADDTALPSEGSWRILDAIIQMAQEYQIVFCMDIFSLVPKEMGDPEGWLSFRERIVDRQKVNIQKEFLALLADRYKDVPGISWDLWNEPRLDKTDIGLLRDWVGELSGVLRAHGDTHPITVGDEMSLEMTEVLDYVCVHTDFTGEFFIPLGIDKPVFFQEIWNDAGSSFLEQTKQAEKMKNDLDSWAKTETAGFAPWQWTRQARLWNNQSEPEQWDDELGVCVNDDGTRKPAGDVYFEFIEQYKSDNQPRGDQ
jgi:Glycosyl hydrolases family 2